MDRSITLMKYFYGYVDKWFMLVVEEVKAFRQDYYIY